MGATPTPDYTGKARQLLDLLPALRHWVTTRVQAASMDNDVSFRQYAALRSIMEGANSPGELARLWQVTPAVITGIVDRLERRKLVRREPDPTDRRRQRLALTASGLAASEHVERMLTDDLAAQLALATPEELAELGRSLQLLHRSFVALAANDLPAVPLAPDDDLPLWAEDDVIAPLADDKPVRSSRRTLAGASS